MKEKTMTDTAGEARLNLDLRERLDDKIARTAPGRERRFFEDLRAALLSSAEAREEAATLAQALREDIDLIARLQAAETRAQEAEARARVERLEAALREIADRYEDVDLSHKDFRVEAVHAARQALQLGEGNG